MTLKQTLSMAALAAALNASTAIARQDVTPRGPGMMDKPENGALTEAVFSAKAGTDKSEFFPVESKAPLQPFPMSGCDSAYKGVEIRVEMTPSETDIGSTVPDRLKGLSDEERAAELAKAPITPEEVNVYLATITQVLSMFATPIPGDTLAKALEPAISEDRVTLDRAKAMEGMKREFRALANQFEEETGISVVIDITLADNIALDQSCAAKKPAP